MTDAEQLLKLKAELQANLDDPQGHTRDILKASLERLRSVAPSVEPQLQVECLLNLVQQFHHEGQDIFSAIEPAAKAVLLAETLNDKPLLRRALNLQGIILSATTHPGDALQSLARALEIAQKLGDIEMQVATQNNIGAAMYEAALYGDAKAAFEQAALLAAPVLRLRKLAGLALSNVALCCLHMREYEDGIAKIIDAIALMSDPTSPAELLSRVFSEGTYTRLLLQRGRTTEGAERVKIAKEFAAMARTVRADISAACSEGLVEVYSGKYDLGLSRAFIALEKARNIKASLRETLWAAVQATEKAGILDKALGLHRELTLHMLKAQRESISRQFPVLQTQESQALAGFRERIAKLLSSSSDVTIKP